MSGGDLLLLSLARRCMPAWYRRGCLSVRHVWACIISYQWKIIATVWMISGCFRPFVFRRERLFLCSLRSIFVTESEFQQITYRPMKLHVCRKLASEWRRDCTCMWRGEPRICWKNQLGNWFRSGFENKLRLNYLVAALFCGWFL